MAKRTRAALGFALGLSLASAVSGCASDRLSNDGAPAPGNTAAVTPGAAERAISEADIIQVDATRLYALSASGTVSVVAVSPGHLELLGQTWLGGRPFEMYRRGDYLVTMWNAAIDRNGATLPPRTGAAGSSTAAPEPVDESRGSAVVVLDVKDPSRITVKSLFPVPGELADSRIVGDVLYLATYENAQCWRCGTKSRTMVTTFDVRDALALQKVDQVAYESTGPEAYNTVWGTNWKRSIVATTERLYIGGHGDIEPSRLSSGSVQEGIIDVLDITDPTGRLVRGARLEVTGAVLSRWQLDESRGVLRVVSQRGAGRTTNGVGMPMIETFTINSTQSYSPLGSTAIKLPRQESLRAVRFDKDRAYAITYFLGDPLFTIDLENPAIPAVRGELVMPGFMYYLEPYGDRLIGLGVDRWDSKGSLNVSLFDVKDLRYPSMLSRVSFGAPSVGSDSTIITGELPEDQDRIQKAFRVFPDGLVAMPFSSAYRPYYGTGDACVTLDSGVQLVEWANDTLKKKSLLPLRGHPRRAFQKDGELVTVSESNVRSFSLSFRDFPVQTADLVIGACTPYNTNEPTEPGFIGDGIDDTWSGHRFGFFACSTTGSLPVHGSASGALAVSLFGLLAAARLLRRKSRA